MVNPVGAIGWAVPLVGTTQKNTEQLSSGRYPTIVTTASQDGLRRGNCRSSEFVHEHCIDYRIIDMAEFERYLRDDREKSRSKQCTPYNQILRLRIWTILADSDE